MSTQMDPGWGARGRKVVECHKINIKDELDVRRVSNIRFDVFQHPKLKFYNRGTQLVCLG